MKHFARPTLRCGFADRVERGFDTTDASGSTFKTELSSNLLKNNLVVDELDSGLQVSRRTTI